MESEVTFVTSPGPLTLGCYYHIYNRGTNGEALFHGARDYRRFLQRYIHDIEPIAETYAYCLMKNHFHLAIRTRTEAEQAEFYAASPAATGPRAAPFEVREPSRQFGILFNAYAKWYNNRYERSGSLFEHPFERKLVGTESYFWRLITYIHRNPMHHGFADDPGTWPWSSYGAMLSLRPTRVQRDLVLDWLGGREGFVEAHRYDQAEQLPDDVLLE
jgi:REP element-mobilizing transposase RayT